MIGRLTCGAERLCSRDAPESRATLVPQRSLRSTEVIFKAGCASQVPHFSKRLGNNIAQALECFKAGLERVHLATRDTELK